MLRINRSWGMLAAGLAIGLSIGGAMSVGVLLGRRTQTAGMPDLSELRLKAMATHGSDTYAIATGSVDDDVEGLYTLDFLTGDLCCFVINPRTGKFGGLFKANVAEVLGAEKGKKPNYLLATGLINVQGYGGNQRPSASLCYVVDANTGDVAAFSFPWAKSATAAGIGQVTVMSVVGRWKTRDINALGR